MNTTCYLIGEDSLLIQCGNQLLSRDYNIILVISPIKSIQRWAKAQNIPILKSIEDFNISEASKVDYIFSIVNSCILPHSFIKLAQKAAINYHDSLLPDYAGLNATSWALLNDEKQHGITWHLLSEEIDEGNILVQHAFPVDENDTALTLNLHCYEQAVASFRELINLLESNRYSSRPQHLACRRYFSATHLLPELGYINWQTMSARFIVKLHRALLLGHYKNNIGCLKIYLESDFLNVTDAHVTDIQSIEKKPGTILSVDLDELWVLTCDEKVVSLRFKTPTIKEILPEAIGQYNLLPGVSLPSLPEHFMMQHSENYRNALRHEKFWIKKLNTSVEHKSFPSMIVDSNCFEQIGESLNISGLLAHDCNKEKATILLTGLLIYFFRLNNYEKTSVFFVSKSQTNSQKELPGLFPCFLPLNLSSIKADNSLNDAIKEVEKEYLYLSDRGGYLGDIFNRHPELENHVSPSIVISFYSVEFNRLPNSVTIYIHVDEKKDCIKCYHRLNRNEQNSNTLQLLKYFNTHLDNIINALISTPEVLVGKFSFLSVAEEKMLSQLGSGKPYVLPTESITTLFEKNVERNPNHPAILMNEHVLSYLQLWQMAEIIAELIQTKTSPNAFIGIYTTRSPIMLAMILGVLKAEGVYVPLDPKYPLGKIDLIVTNANVTLILTTSNFEKKLSDFFETRNSVMIIDSEMILDRSSSIKTFRKALIRPHTDRLAYTMFTSGTTGEPKGVVISQRNVINYCCWFSDTTTLNSEAVIDFSSSIAFDLSVPCTIAPLIVGSTIAICSEEEKVNPQRYLKHLQRFQVTHIELTPGYLELVLNYPDEIRQLKKLNYLMLGADVVHTSEVEAWLALSPQTQIVNEYGPTETTVSVTSYFVQPSELSKISSVPIGKPAFNSVCYVLDKHNNLCPFGMKGELYAGGEQIALGYLNLSQITAEKFIDLKFNNQSIRLYRTGDEVCWNSNGQLQFFGRNDFQVKIHGYRVELSAIETLLMQYPEIHQAVVILKKDDKEKSLCAYLVVADKLTIMLDNLKNFLAHHLPNYMLPKEFYLVDSIPLKENEKIDFDSLKSEIPKQLLSQPVLQQDNLTSTQTTCLGIWQTIFNKQSIQLEDNFFDIGGDSLIALEIITSLKKHYAVPISLSYLFEHPTIASLSEKIDELLSQYRPQKGIFNLTNTLIKLSTGTYPIPLFLIHPVGGSIFWYQSLAKQLEGKLTIYGIQDPNLEGDNQCFHSIQEMAKFYIQTMFTIYQGDQFYLGGASFGATVAFEMAYQLQQANLKINFLGLMDGWAHYPVNLMQTNSLSLITQNQEKYLSHERYRILLKQEEYRQQLLCDYSLPILATKVSLFKAQDLWKSFMEIDDPCNGWQKYVDGKIAVHLVPGNHQSMFFPPNIEKWAHLLIPDRF